jgi:hypothetical protein
MKNYFSGVWSRINSALAEETVPERIAREKKQREYDREVIATYIQSLRYDLPDITRVMLETDSEGKKQCVLFMDMRFSNNTYHKVKLDVLGKKDMDQILIRAIEALDFVKAYVPKDDGLQGFSPHKFSVEPDSIKSNGFEYSFFRMGPDFWIKVRGTQEYYAKEFEMRRRPVANKESALLVPAESAVHAGRVQPSTASEPQTQPQ